MFVDNAPPPFQYEAYTLGLGYGRVRVMTLSEFEAANRAGRFTFQDGVVIENVAIFAELGVGALALAFDRLGERLPDEATKLSLGE